MEVSRVARDATGTENMAISSYLREYATRVAALLGEDVEASITMREHGVNVRGGSSSPAAARCDQAEAMADDGPCVEAIRSAGLFTVPSVADDPRWPAWREQSMREGFVRAIAQPADVAPGIAVALNLYSRTPAAWDERTVRSAGTSAELVASAVRLQLQFADLEDAAGSLYRRMSDAVAVERAVGAIIQLNACTEPQARALLRSAADTQGVEEREIAVTILRSLAAGARGDIVDDSAAAGKDPSQP